jgi:hypothetical protein
MYLSRNKKYHHPLNIDELITCFETRKITMAEYVVHMERRF